MISNQSSLYLAFTAIVSTNPYSYQLYLKNIYKQQLGIFSGFGALLYVNNPEAK